jgi:hypothetical protein
VFTQNPVIFASKTLKKKDMKNRENTVEPA